MFDRPELRHMLILAGSDFEQEFTMRAGVAVRIGLPVFLGGGTIYIWDSLIAAPAQTILTYGRQNFKLLEPLIVGARSMVCAADGLWSGNAESLPADTEIGVSPIDITNWTFRSQIWVSREAKLAQLAPLATFTCAVTDGAAGKFKLSLPNSISTPLTPTCSWEDYQDVKIEDLGKTDVELKRIYGNQAWRLQALASSAYYWDLESIDPALRVLRRLEGLILLSKERTR